MVGWRVESGKVWLGGGWRGVRSWHVAYASGKHRHYFISLTSSPQLSFAIVLRSLLLKLFNEGAVLRVIG